jgi:hypothetical protein
LFDTTPEAPLVVFDERDHSVSITLDPRFVYDESMVVMAHKRVDQFLRTIMTERLKCALRESIADLLHSLAEQGYLFREYIDRVPAKHSFDDIHYTYLGHWESFDLYIQEKKYRLDNKIFLAVTASHSKFGSVSSEDPHIWTASLLARERELY